MSTGITERNKANAELAGLGYSIKALEKELWQPKVTLYRHTPAYNNSGQMSDDIGTTIKNLPSEPSYIARCARLGQFTFPPSESCICPWCKERKEQGVDVTEEDGATSVVSPLHSKTCEDCGAILQAASSGGLSTKFKYHKERLHSEA